MWYHVKEKKLHLLNTTIDYIAFGTGKTPLIMLQGLNTRSIKRAGFSLAYMYRLFAKDYTVYLFDRRCDVGEGLTVSDLADDVAASMDALGIACADVLGVSQGGMIAQYLAIKRPDLVHAMVLAVTLCENNKTIEKVICNWLEMTERRDWKALVADMTEKMYSENYLRRYQPLLPLLTILQKPKDPRRFSILAKACLTCNTADFLANVSCPVLVIGGGKDQIVGTYAAAELAEKLGCECVVYDDLGHAAYEEAKDFNQRVYDFFKSHR